MRVGDLAKGVPTRKMRVFGPHVHFAQRSPGLRMLRGMNVVGLLLLVCAPDAAEQAAILKKYAKQPYEQRHRIDAIYKLGRIGNVESTRALEAVLDDPFGHVQDLSLIHI